MTGRFTSLAPGSLAIQVTSWLKRERAEKVAPIEKSKFWMKISEKY